MNASTNFFDTTAPVAFGGPERQDPLAFRWYDKDRIVRGRRLEDHLRFAVCYWHSFGWPGGDPFGGETFLRPWHHGADPMALARAKADVAFELFRLLDVPFFTFHDVDVAPEGASLAESVANLNAIADLFEQKMATAKVRLLWGTANLFSHRRYMAGAATNPDPDVFAYAAGQVRAALEVTHRLGGQNYVLWGGREGYETLLNTDIKRELDQLGRFVSLVVEHKHKIGFKGPILIEPKPKEPTKHQYDFDVATCYGFLQRYDLLNDVKLNIEQNHAILAGHSFQHEVALAEALGVFGSLDINRGDDLLGWDTDQFAMNVPELALVFHEIAEGRRLHHRRSQLRRQDQAAVDRSGRSDPCPCRLDGCLRARRSLPPPTCSMPARSRRRSPSATRDGLVRRAAPFSPASARSPILPTARLPPDFDPQPRSGRQEYLESLVNRYV